MTKKILTNKNNTRLNDTIHASEYQCDLCRNRDFEFLFDHHHGWKVQQCNSCLLAQIIPRPTFQFVTKLYEGDLKHFDPYIDQLSVHQKYFDQKLSMVQMLLSENKRTFKTMLDIGCLTGVLLGEAKKKNIQAVGVDISADAVRYCKDQGYQAFHGTIKEYADKNNTKKYDAITAFEIIEHEYSPITLAKTMFTLLKSGGIAVATTPNHGSWWRKLMGKYWPGYTHTEHLYFFDMDSLKEVFIRAGFSEVTVRRDEKRPFPLSFLFTRGADYLPFGKTLARMVGTALKPFPIHNPINPWDDIIVIARK